MYCLLAISIYIFELDVILGAISVLGKVSGNKKVSKSEPAFHFTNSPPPSLKSEMPVFFLTMILLLISFLMKKNKRNMLNVWYRPKSQ